MSAREEYIHELGKILAERTSQGLLRAPTVPHPNSADFSSNDYLGLARSSELHTSILSHDLHLRTKNSPIIGSTGSRLLSGNNSLYESVERKLAEFHAGKSALLFNSGYDLNLGLMATIAQPQDVIIADDLTHNSMREGLRLSRAKRILLFNHNDIAHLETLFIKVRSDEKKCNIFVAVEGVYSMDGDLSPLNEILLLCEKYSALLIIDEAHSLGVYGRQGRGLLDELSLDQHPNVIARVYTFGKALGCHGAVLICDAELKSFMLNYHRPLIYSTSLSFHALYCIQEGYNFMQKYADERQIYLRQLIEVFKSEVAKRSNIHALDSISPVQGIICPGNDRVMALAAELQKRGFDAKGIRSPTVPKGTERIRVILHHHNSRDEIIALLQAVDEIQSPANHLILPTTPSTTDLPAAL